MSAGRVGTDPSCGAVLLNHRLLDADPSLPYPKQQRQCVGMQKSTGLGEKLTILKPDCQAALAARLNS